MTELTAIKVSEGDRPLEFILSEANFHRSRANVVFAEHDTDDIRPGEVCAIVSAGAAVAAAKAGGNTGNGTFVMDATTPILAGVRAGVYTARFVTLTSVRLEGPDGAVIGDTAIGGSATNAATISEQIKALVTQGSTPFVVGDGFNVTVAAGSAKHVPLDVDGVNGSQVAASIACYPYPTSAGDQDGVAIVRDAEVKKDLLIWPAGIETGERATAIAQLAAAGIIVR